jgi:hypothetical protein
LGDLVEERLDLALRCQPGDTSIIARVIGTFGRVLVHLIWSGARRHPSDLAQHNCIIHETGPEPLDRGGCERHLRDRQQRGGAPPPPWPATARQITEIAGGGRYPPPGCIGCWLTIRQGASNCSCFTRPGGDWRRTGVMIDCIVALGHADKAQLADAGIWGENETT